VAFRFGPARINFRAKSFAAIPRQAMETHQDEEKALVRTFSDKARKVKKSGKSFIVPHKVKPDGEVITQENLNAKTDISQLNLNELRFLDVFRTSGWNIDKAANKAGLTTEQAKKTYKKCLWFADEDAIVRAKAKVPSPEYILAKDVDNVEGAIELSDSDHKSLDRIAKITGSFKAQEINITQNNLIFPKMSAEAEAAIRQLADKEADVVETTIVQ
jgi:hypothetical protein